MEPLRLITKAQELLALLQEPERVVALQTLLADLASLLQYQADLAAQLVHLETETRRHEAESGSRLRECGEREAAGQRRYEEAERARAQDLATLAQRIEGLKTEVAELTAERHGLREAVAQARAEHADVLKGLTLERTAATQALEAARTGLAKLREAIPA